MSDRRVKDGAIEDRALFTIERIMGTIPTPRSGKDRRERNLLDEAERLASIEYWEAEKLGQERLPTSIKLIIQVLERRR